MYLLEHKVIVVTGATSGIGKATAKVFAEAGATVLLVGRNEKRGRELVDEINALGRQAYFYRCDVSNEREVKRLVSDISKEYDHVDVLFNNAGIMPPSTEIENMPAEDWERAFEVNIDGIFYVTRNLKSLIFACKGCIINNASIAGMHSYVTGRSYAYSASKAAVIQFSRQMAKNYAQDGVRVNCICPGIIDTPILGARDRKVYAERVPMGYLGRSEDVANAVLFLASDQASYITGVVLPVDGGVHL